MKKSLSIIICMLLVLNSILWMPCTPKVEAVTNDTSTLTIGKTASGSIESGLTERYKIEPTRIGLLTISIKCYVKDVLSTSFISGNDSHRILNQTSYYNKSTGYSTTKYSVYVNPSTYYLEMSNSIVVLSGKYKIKSSFKPINCIEGNGKNQSGVNAVKLRNNIFYYGVLAMDDKVDYYYIKFSKASKLMLNIHCINDKSVKLVVFDSKGKSIAEGAGHDPAHPYTLNKEVAAGKYTIAITRNNLSDKINGINYSIITGKYIKITNMKLPATKKLDLGYVCTFDPVLTPSNATGYYTYTTSNPKIIYLNDAGQLVGIREGTATVTATTVDGKISSSCKVTVKDMN